MKKKRLKQGVPQGLREEQVYITDLAAQSISEVKEWRAWFDYALFELEPNNWLIIERLTYDRAATFRDWAHQWCAKNQPDHYAVCRIQPDTEREKFEFAVSVQYGGWGVD